MMRSCFVGLAIAGVLSSCGTPGVKMGKKPIAESPLMAVLVNPKALTPEARWRLREENLLGTYRRDPAEAVAVLQKSLDESPSMERRLELAELCSKTGDRLFEKEPDVALGYYLKTAELAFDNYRAQEDDRGREALRSVYNHGCQRVARLLYLKGAQAGSDTLDAKGPDHDYTLRIRRKGEGLIDPAYFDSVVPSNYMKFRKLDFERLRREGFGADLVAHRLATPERLAAEPFLPEMGLLMAVASTLRFVGDDVVDFSLHDLLLKDTVQGRDGEVPLSADFTAPLASLYNYAPKHNIGWDGMRHPEEYADKSGIFQFEPFRKDRIPVVLVHGLMSSPRVWIKPINMLRADPVLRKHYQLIAFYYPTGFPVAYSAAALRRELKNYTDHYDPNGSNPNLRRMVLAGHSMGGLLSNSQIRDSGDHFTSKLFDVPMDEVEGMSAEQREAMRELLIFEASPDVERAIFVAAPHRGSDMVNGTIGKLGMKLISFPRELITRQPLPEGEGMTDIGREIAASRPSGVSSLKPRQVGLMATLDMDVSPRVTYHSIIGRKKASMEIEESSDGVVPYWSSHLDGAASEKIVVATHTSITSNEEAIEEARRILYKHVGEPYTPR